MLTAQTAGVAPTLGPWALVGRTDVPGAWSDQGLATVTRPGGGSQIDYAGTLTVSSALEAGGWSHVGDPDGWGGWLVTPFQGGPGSRSKMFEVSAPDGAVTRAVHPLAPGELANNSFAAVTPDGQWTVSAEWGTESRLLVFPTPMINPAYSPGAPLPLAATIHLREPVSDLQGCAFATATSLMCSGSSDLLEIDLDQPIQPGYYLSATVHALGPLPEGGTCQGTYEPEGVDIDRALHQLRVEMTQSGVCALFTQVYQYRWIGG